MCEPKMKAGIYPFPKVNVPNVGPPTIELKSVVITYDKMAFSTNQIEARSFEPIREDVHLR